MTYSPTVGTDHTDASCPSSREATALDALHFLIGVVMRENSYTLENNDSDPTTVDDYVADVVVALQRHLSSDTRIA